MMRSNDTTHVVLDPTNQRVNVWLTPTNKANLVSFLTGSQGQGSRGQGSR